MPNGTTAEMLAAIDFGSQTWALAIDGDGVFVGGDVTSTQDPDEEPNPDSAGGTVATATFAVQPDDDVNLPVIGEPALEGEAVSSTKSLSEELETEIATD